MSRPVLRSALVAGALLLAGLTGAPSASAASAQDFAVGSAEFQRARDIAQAHWGAVPCQGQVQFSWQGLEPLVNARATWSNPTHAWENVGANFNCTVVFNALTQYDFPMLCTVMAHELGHLLGRQHELRDGVLMSAIYSAPLPECGGPPAASASADQHADEADPIAWSVEEPTARKKKSTKRASKKTSAKRKRCVVRMESGKRVRRCVALKKRATHKARTASHTPQLRVYVAH